MNKYKVTLVISKVIKANDGNHAVESFLGSFEPDELVDRIVVKRLKA